MVVYFTILGVTRLSHTLRTMLLGKARLEFERLRLETIKLQYEIEALKMAHGERHAQPVMLTGIDIVSQAAVPTPLAPIQIASALFRLGWPGRVLLYAVLVILRCVMWYTYIALPLLLGSLVSRPSERSDDFQTLGVLVIVGAGTYYLGVYKLGRWLRAQSKRTDNIIHGISVALWLFVSLVILIMIIWFAARWE